jgi:tetratricopeptide (TPR) repeat protein
VDGGSRWAAIAAAADLKAVNRSQGHARCHNRYGLPLSTVSPTAARWYAVGLDAALALQPGARTHFRQAIEADPEFALAHAALALEHHHAGAGPTAQAALSRARGAARGATLREQRHVLAVGAAISGDVDEALRQIEAHLEDFPHDALLLREAGELYTWSGRLTLRRDRLALLRRQAPYYGDDWWYLGDVAFDLADLGQVREARRLARRALALNPRSAGAAHSLAHAFVETQDLAGAVAFLRAWLPRYDVNGGEHSHLSWHLAMAELGLGHAERAMAVYRRLLDPAALPNRRLCDAASFLWRRFMARPGAPLPWGPVHRLAAAAAAQPDTPFQHIHAAMALAGAGDRPTLCRLVDGLHALAARGHPTAGSLTLPLVQGLDAFARGAYGEAIRLVEPTVGQLERLGGSNQQRAVFVELLAAAGRRA